MYGIEKSKKDLVKSVPMIIMSCTETDSIIVFLPILLMLNSVVRPCNFNSGKIRDVTACSD